MVISSLIYSQRAPANVLPLKTTRYSPQILLPPLRTQIQFLQDSKRSFLLSSLAKFVSLSSTIPSPPPANTQVILSFFIIQVTTENQFSFSLFQTFCTKCLHRSLDHGATCPLCRQSLPGFHYFQEHPPNQVILSLLLKAFPALYRERGEAIEAEERDARLDTPIFVCQLSFPGMPTLLHFFEPRYRLMLRRCLESPNPCFGMVVPSKGGLSPHLDYGTMLEIRSVQMQPDGRSYVETWGTYRFRILELGTLDGYMVGRIERIDDYPEDSTEAPTPDTSHSAPLTTPDAGSSTDDSVTPAEQPISRETAQTGPSTSQSESRPAQETIQDESSTPHPDPPPPQDQTPSVTSATDSEPSNEASLNPLSIPLPNHPSNSVLMEQCRTFLNQLQQGTAPWIVQRLSSTYGTMPTDVSSFSYWVASILPIDEQEKAKLLPIRSPRLRLLLVVHWIEQLNNNWYNVFYFTRVVTRGLLLIGLLFFFWSIISSSFIAVVDFCT
ncbi:hypothetical protein H0H93_002369 [Arthromyces matolae]|nr:hypothetical protein H0H93_002369 [Arthromyces matolae]